MRSRIYTINCAKYKIRLPFPGFIKIEHTHKHAQFMYLLHGQGASLKEMIWKRYDAIFLCIAHGLFSDCTAEIKLFIIK